LAQALVKTMIPEKISIRGVDLLLNKQDAVVSGALSLGCYETELLERFETALRPGMTVIDIGANIGLYTIIASRGVGPSGSVIAIEPAQENCSFIERSLALNQMRNATVFQKALGDKNGLISLFLCSNNKADHRVYDKSGTRKSVPVEMVRLDDLLKTTATSSVDVIKMDVQGAEAFALAGMRETLRTNQGVKVFMEFWPWGLRQAGSDPLKLLRDIRELGFKIYEFSDRTAEAIEITDDLELKCALERQHANLFLERK